MAFTDADRQAMDNAAVDAENDLLEVEETHLTTVANWWKKWYMWTPDRKPGAGHKRLARILLQYADKEGG